MMEESQVAWMAVRKDHHAAAGSVEKMDFSMVVWKAEKLVALMVALLGIALAV